MELNDLNRLLNGGNDMNDDDLYQLGTFNDLARLGKKLDTKNTPTAKLLDKLDTLTEGQNE